MKTLYLARHAKSSWDDHGIADFDRPLNKRGLKDAPLIGKVLRDLGETPEVIVSSPANRAATTARFFAEAFGLPAERIMLETPLYGASPDAILDVINGLDDGWSKAMIVGHNPGMAQIAADFSTDPSIEMPTCAVAAFEFPVASWSLVRGKGTMKFRTSPKKHREE